MLLLAKWHTQTSSNLGGFWVLILTNIPNQRLSLLLPAMQCVPSSVSLSCNIYCSCFSDKKDHNRNDFPSLFFIEQYSPFTKIWELGNGTVLYNGYCIEMLNVMADTLNFR